MRWGNLSCILPPVYCLLLSDVCFGDIAAHHAVGVDVIGVLANCILVGGQRVKSLLFISEALIRKGNMP
jgi:hypothetical protein